MQLWTLPRDKDQLRDYGIAGLDLLPADERSRFERFASTAAAHRFLLGRVLMRQALAANLGREPQSIVVGLDSNGKPRLLQPENTDLTFSLSHSRRDWVLALTRRHDIGVDLETHDRGPRIRGIATAYFSAPEQRYLEQQGDQAAKSALQLWTLKEAVVKAAGQTVWQGLGNVRLAIDGGRISWLAAPGQGMSGWSLALGSFRNDHSLAIALRSADEQPPPLTVHCRQLGTSVGHCAPFRFEAHSWASAANLTSG